MAAALRAVPPWLGSDARRSWEEGPGLGWEVSQCSAWLRTWLWAWACPSVCP